MISSPYVSMTIISVTGGHVAVLSLRYKQINHTELYREGVRNENRKLKLDTKFGVKISQRIKVLRHFMGYENSFRFGCLSDISKHFTYTMNE